MHRKQNYDIVFGFTSDTAKIDFYFFLSLPLSFLAFLASFFFSFAGHLVDFIWWEKVLGKLLGS